MKNYKKVYFRINTPSYYKNKYGVGFENQQEGELFFNSVKALFLGDGWEIKKEKYSGNCPTVTKDNQELYIHPQNFSGVVLVESIKQIEQLINNQELFKFESTDIYEDILDITDEQYINMLKGQQEEIEKDILEAYKTKRSNLYIVSAWSPLQAVLDKYKVKRITHYSGVLTSNDIDYKYIQDVFNSLVEQNKIVTANCKNGKGYRTINKTEQKKLKICLGI